MVTNVNDTGKNKFNDMLPGVEKLYPRLLAQIELVDQTIPQGGEDVNTKFSIDDDAAPVLQVPEKPTVGNDGWKRLVWLDTKDPDYQAGRERYERQHRENYLSGLAESEPPLQAIGTADEFFEIITETSAAETGEDVVQAEPIQPREAEQREPDSFAAEIRRQLTNKDAVPEPAKKVELTAWRGDLDEYWKLVEQTAEIIAGPKTDPMGSVRTEGAKKKKTLRESSSDAWSYFRRKMVDSGEAVSRIGKAVGDDALYAYYNMARASSNAAVSMIQDAQTDITGKRIGKSLNEIFAPIRGKGREYYQKFQLYMYHVHNIDRMSRYSESRVNEARAAFEDFKAENPELGVFADYQIEQLAYDPSSLYQTQAYEYIQLRDNMRRVENTVNKPVFAYDITAEDSKAASETLLRENPEFADMAEAVYSYIDGLMQYRVDSGLITEADLEMLNSTYPNYVPTFREYGDSRADRKDWKDSVMIGKTIGRAEGGEAPLMPLHKALAKQTFSVVREGSKNRFGQRLLNSKADRTKDAARHVLEISEYESDFHVNTFDAEPDELSKQTNTFIVREDGNMWQMNVSPALYDGVKALSPDTQEVNAFTKAVRAGNDLFKKSVTGYNPVFTARNFMRDLQDAGLYSKNLHAFVAAYPQAIKEIATNGKYWQQYKALGGTYSSIFDYDTGELKNEKWLMKNTIGRIEALNMAVEQAPRLAEFIATVKHGDGSMDNLMTAMYNAAEVTVNFGRSGTLGKMLNANYIPFLNPGIQGFSKMMRSITETKGAKRWFTLAVKMAVFGIAPVILNTLLFGDEDGWENIKDYDKDNNYLFKLPNGEWLRLPKGRVLSLIGMTYDRLSDLIRGDDVNWGEYLSTAATQVAPTNPLEENILKAWWDADLLDKKSPGKTWYGSDIESRRLQNYAPGERYDERTDLISKWLGDVTGLSPKKINYLLDSYTGVAGDFLLPLMTPQAERDPFTRAFKLDTAYSNRISGDFYEMLDELTFAKNTGEATGADDVVFRYWNRQATAVSEINAIIRDIELDSDLTNSEKRELARAQYMIRNELEKLALEKHDAFSEAAHKQYERAGSAEDEEDRIDQAYRETNREVFGAEYALSVYNKQVYQKAQEYNKRGVSYEDYYDVYFEINNINRDSAMKGATASNARRDVIARSGLSEAHKTEMYRAFISEEKDEDIEAFKLAGLDIDKYIEAQNIYTAINERDIKATEKATEFSRWVNSRPYSQEQAVLVKDTFTYFNPIPAEAAWYDKFTSAGVPEETSYELAYAIGTLKPLPGSSNVTDMQRYRVIDNARLSEKEKIAAIGSIMGTSMTSDTGSPSQYAKMLSLLDSGLSVKEYLDAQSKYTSINERDLKATEKATEFSRWINAQNYSEDQATLIRNSFTYFQMVPTEAERYNSFIEAGLPDEISYKLTQALANLQPEEGYEYVSPLQRYRAVVDTVEGDEAQLAALSVLMTGESDYLKVSIGYRYDITPRQYVIYKEMLIQADSHNSDPKKRNGSIDQDEVKAALNRMLGLTNTQKAVLFQLQNKAWKTNPYDKAVADRVRTAMEGPPTISQQPIPPPKLAG